MTHQIFFGHLRETEIQFWKTTDVETLSCAVTPCAAAASIILKALGVTMSGMCLHIPKQHFYMAM